jgi:predicted transcriptional regulator YdeE
MSCRTRERLTIVGISDRVSNAEPSKIGDLWRRFHAMGDQEAIAAFCNRCMPSSKHIRPI